MTAQFTARKVRLGRAYYVHVQAPDGTRHRIGTFKFRARAKDWIAQHAGTWTPDGLEPQQAQTEATR